MQSLKQHLYSLIAQLSKDDEAALRLKLDNLMSVYPFNEYEFIISSLLGMKKLNLDDYYLMEMSTLIKQICFCKKRSMRDVAI
jgi:hypothetical protein